MTATSASIADLWAGFDEHPDDLGRLLVIADAYRDEGMDTWADCLQWCYRNERKPYVDLLRTVHAHEWIAKRHQNEHNTNRNGSYIPEVFDSVCIKYECGIIDWESKHVREYYQGHPTPSLAYQFLCRMWDDIGGVKEDQ